jgi:serine/threonine protein kinase/WD40 repeat protein
MSDDCPSAADPFGQIADEFVEAFRQGKRPSVEEFARRYPAHADEIRDMLPALVVMERARAAEDTTAQRRCLPATAPLQLGDYQILREVGRGGMGVVYEAQQLSLGRHVAIKVLPSHALLDPRQLGRFQREARSAAKLHHTNIVPVFGVGEQDGLHYYVMQFIQGLGLDVVLDELRRLRQSCDKQALTVGDAQGRSTSITRYVSAASVARSLLTGEFRPPEEKDEGGRMKDEGREHGAADSSFTLPPSSFSSSATIHLPGQSETSTLTESGSQYWQSVARVGVQVADALAHAASQGVLHRDIKPSNLLLDETGNVWVTDFGLAKAQSDSDDLTHTGDVVGTLRYMAPERFNGQGDLRSDVYSLGLTLYELLVLRPAFDETDRNRLVKRVMHDEPVRLRKLNPAVPRDLETVVQKAIARDPAHRYQTPAEMAEDLKRFVEDRPVKARRISEGERLWRWCRRNPLSASLVAGIVLVFLAGFAGVFGQWRVAESAREEERKQRDRVELLRQGAETAREAAQAEAYLAVLSEVRALRAGHESGWRKEALNHLARLAVMPTPRRDLAELRTEAAATLGTPDICLAARVALPGPALGSFTFSPDGRNLLTADRQTGLDFWDLPGNQHQSFVESARVSDRLTPHDLHDRVVYLANGQGLIVGTDQGVIFTDLHGSRTPHAPITQQDSKPTKLSLSADGQRIAVAWTGSAGTTVHNVASGALLARFKDANPILALSPDGNWLGRLENDDIVLLPIPSGESRVVLGHHSGANALAYSPNGDLLAGAFADHTTVLWDVAKREQLHTFRGHRERVLDVAFSPDGEWIATGSLDYTTRIWDTRTGQNLATLPGFSSPTFAVKWSPAGDFLAASLNNSREVLIYKITGRHGVQQWLTGHGVELSWVAADPRGKRLTTSGYTELLSWDLSSSRPAAVAKETNSGWVTALTYSPDGSLVAVASWRSADQREIEIRDAGTCKLRCRLTVPQIVRALAFDPTSAQLASGDDAGNVFVWDLAISHPVQQFATGSAVYSIIFLDHPRSLVTHGRDALVHFNLQSGKRERQVELGGGGIRKLVTDPQQTRLVVGFVSGAIGSLSLPDVTPGPRIEKAHEGNVDCMALSPDGGLLATASDHRVVLREARSFETLLRFPLWDGTLRNLTFDATGRRLAIVGTGSDVDLWDLAALRDGLTEVGLCWDRPEKDERRAQDNSNSSFLLHPSSVGDRLVVPIIRRPGSTDPVALEEAHRLVQSGIGAFGGGRWVEAIGNFQQARERLRTLNQLNPGDGQVAGRLALILGCLGSALKNEHRITEAQASFKESCQVVEVIRQPTAADLYNLACAYANLSNLVEPGSARPTATDREALAGQAMAALRRSLDAGMTDLAWLKRDPDLDPLRERPDFRALMEELAGTTGAVKRDK